MSYRLLFLLPLLCRSLASPLAPSRASSSASSSKRNVTSLSLFAEAERASSSASSSSSKRNVTSLSLFAEAERESDWAGVTLVMVGPGGEQLWEKSPSHNKNPLRASITLKSDGVYLLSAVYPESVLSTDTDSLACNIYWRVKVDQTQKVYHGTYNTTLAFSLSLASPAPRLLFEQNALTSKPVCRLFMYKGVGVISGPGAGCDQKEVNDGFEAAVATTLYKGSSMRTAVSVLGSCSAVNIQSSKTRRLVSDIGARFTFRIDILAPDFTDAKSTLALISSTLAAAVQDGTLVSNMQLGEESAVHVEELKMISFSSRSEGGDESEETDYLESLAESAIVIVSGVFLCALVLLTLMGALCKRGTATAPITLLKATGGEEIYNIGMQDMDAGISLAEFGGRSSKKKESYKRVTTENDEFEFIY